MLLSFCLASMQFQHLCMQFHRVQYFAKVVKFASRFLHREGYSPPAPLIYSLALKSEAKRGSSFQGSRHLTCKTFLKDLVSCFVDSFLSAFSISREEWRRGKLVWHSSDQVLGSSKILRYRDIREDFNGRGQTSLSLQLK